MNLYTGSFERVRSSISNARTNASDPQLKFLLNYRALYSMGNVGFINYIIDNRIHVQLCCEC